MRCREARAKLAQRSVPAAPLAAHLTDCPECAAFAAALEAVRGAAAGHHAGVEPDASFSARVMARVGRRGDPVEALGNQKWAREAPVLVLSVTRLAMRHNGKPNRHAYRRSSNGRSRPGPAAGGITGHASQVTRASGGFA